MRLSLSCHPQLSVRAPDLPTTQRSARETQLKKAEEEMAELAEQNAELATNQRSALETQLKKAEEDSRQAQKHADFAANQSKSGQTQPLNPGKNSESVTSP